MVSYMGLIFWWIEIRLSIDNGYKGLIIKVIMFILNWDMVDNTPRSGAKFVNHNEKVP